MSLSRYTRRKGFTLIELLIVISIIAILSAIGLVSYSNFMKSSRDARRQSDLKFIQSALEEYYSDQIYYPASITSGSSLTAGSKTYMNKVPTDPTATPDYSYTAFPVGCNNTSTNCTSYYLFANMENTAPPSDNGCPAFPSGGYDYCVTKP